MKKIMILGAGQYQMPIIQKAKERGLYTIVVSPDGDYPGFAVADKSYYLDVKDQEGVLKAAAAEGIDGITTDQTDIAVRTEAYVSEKLGLPGISYDCACIFTDKSLMRSKCVELGIPTIRHLATGSLDEAIAFYDEIGRDAILKPVDNQGSRGVYRISRREDIGPCYEHAIAYSKSGRVIIEEFIEGQEYEVDSIVYNYEEKTLLYGDVIPFDIPGIFAAKTRMYPSASDSVLVKRLLDYNSSVITGFGLKQGLTHSEYIVDGSGQPYLLESAARGGGGFISSHIVKLHTGIDTAEFLIDLALGNIDRMPEFSELPNVVCYVAFFLPEGKVVSDEGLAEVKALDYLHAHSLDDIYIGKKTGSFSDKTHRYVNVLSADTREELAERIDHFKKTLKVTVETPEGLKLPVWE